MRIIFAGTPEFAIPSLQAIIASDHLVCGVYTQPDRPAGRGRKLTPSPIKLLAQQHDIPVFQPLSLKPEADQQQFEELNSDLLIVVAYGLILPQAILDIPKLGVINVHASLLPRWRGAAPIQRAVLAGDHKTGVTIMKVVKKLDAGDMLYKLECQIDEVSSASQLQDQLSILGAQALKQALPGFEKGIIVPERQDETEVTHAAKLEKSEAELDWTLSAHELARKVRGLNAWPVAQTVFNGQVLRVWRAEAIHQPSSSAKPGSVSSDGKGYLDVATSDGVLRLLEVQLPGGKRISVSAFLNAHPVNQSNPISLG